MVSKKTSRDENDEHLERAIPKLKMTIGFGLLVVIVYPISSLKLTEIISNASTGLMLAGASLLAGGLLGFLFGIPRTLQRETLGEPREREKVIADQDEKGITYQVNTNLEQISDWLTKIIVGVGLTQLNKIPGKIQEVAQFAAQGMACSQTLAVALIIFFTVSGFFYSYLWARLYLGTLLRAADLAMLKKEVKKYKDQRSADDTASELVEIQLEHPEKHVDEEMLKTAIKSALPGAKARIFYQAQEIRSDNWKKDKSKMERTIPIFRALVESDVDDDYHRNHGQLGYALKDQRKPDWAEAESELSKAIEIRDKKGDLGWIYYEFNRAVCRINLDKDFKNNRKSKPDVAKGIVADLKKSVEYGLEDLIMKIDEINKWLKINKVTL
jgi:hypothetical protein